MPSPHHGLYERIDTEGLRISRGLVPGWSPIIIRGRNLDIDAASGFEDIWAAGGAATYLSAADTMDVVSDDTNDTNTAGTGARKILVEGVSSTYANQSETVNLNGTTAVTTALEYLFVNCVTVTEAGSGLKNAGNISITDTTGASAQAYIEAGAVISQKSHYLVPLGYTLYFDRIELNASKAGGSSPLVAIEGHWRDMSVSTDPWLRWLDKKIDTSVENEILIDLPRPTKVAEKYLIRFSADTDVNNTEVQTRMYAALYEGVDP